MLASQKSLPSPVKKKEGLSVSIQASGVDRALAVYFGNTPTAKFLEDSGIKISGRDELPVEWYNPEPKFVDRSAVRQSDYMAQHAAQPEASAKPTNPGIRSAAVPSWHDQLANTLTAGINEDRTGNIELCFASIKKISFDGNKWFQLEGQTFDR